MGYDVGIPGVREERKILREASGYRVFDNTGDGRVIYHCPGADGLLVVDSTDEQWNAAAYAYARAYNQALDAVGR